MKYHYKEADGIDQLLNELLQENPVTLKSAKNWITFCRTVTSSLDVIKYQARDLLSDEINKSTKETKMADVAEECSFIEKVWTEQTGGNVMVDYIRLKSGELIGITDEAIVNYGKVQNTWDADENLCYDNINVIYLCDIKKEA
jgi:hypothetical protein